MRVFLSFPNWSPKCPKPLDMYYIMYYNKISEENKSQGRNKKMYQSNNFKFGRNAYATSQEYRDAEMVRSQEAQDYEDSRREAISWTTKSGQEIEVYVDGASIQVHVHGKGWYDDCQFSSNVPEAAKAAGIVASLGPIGVNVEQKSAIQAKMGK